MPAACRDSERHDVLGATRGELNSSPPVSATRGIVPVESQAGIRAHETRCIAFPSGVRRGSTPRGTRTDSGAVTHPSSLTVAGAAQESRQGRSPVSRLSRPKIRRGHLKSGMECTTKLEPDTAVRHRGPARTGMPLCGRCCRILTNRMQNVSLCVDSYSFCSV